MILTSSPASKFFLAYLLYLHLNPKFRLAFINIMEINVYKCQTKINIHIYCFFLKWIRWWREDDDDEDEFTKLGQYIITKLKVNTNIYIVWVKAPLRNETSWGD